MFSDVFKIALSVVSTLWGGKGRDESQYSQAFAKSANISTPTKVGNLLEEK